MTNYQSEIREKIRQDTGLPVYGIAVPTGEPTPKGTRIHVTFKAPTLSYAGRGIISSRKDLHQVVFFVRVTGTDEANVSETMLAVWESLNGYCPDKCGEIQSIIGETWPTLDSKSKPQMYNEAMSFVFFNNLEGMQCGTIDHGGL